MDTKIQELTDKIYKEGVEKGNLEAQKIFERAKAEEQQIIQTAKKEAAKIVADAQKQAGDLKKNTQAELQLFANQSVEALKTEIANLITDKIAASSVTQATGDKTFMQKVILSIVQEWVKNEPVIIRSGEADELAKFFEANAKSLLDKGVKIERVNGIKTAFEIVPADGSYKIAFGDQEFINYFKEFLRPQLVEMLFS